MRKLIYVFFCAFAEIQTDKEKKHSVKEADYLLMYVWEGDSLSETEGSVSHRRGVGHSRQAR